MPHIVEENVSWYGIKIEKDGYQPSFYEYVGFFRGTDIGCNVNALQLFF